MASRTVRACLPPAAVAAAALAFAACGAPGPAAPGEPWADPDPAGSGVQERGATGSPEPDEPVEPSGDEPGEQQRGAPSRSDLTLCALRDGPERETPQTVFVAAWYRGRWGCDPCPPEFRCQPCIEMLRFSDTPDAPEEDILLLHSFTDDEDLVEGQAYTLQLELRERYREHLRARENNPLYFRGVPDVRLVGVE